VIRAVRSAKTKGTGPGSSLNPRADSRTDSRKNGKKRERGAGSRERARSVPRYLSPPLFRLPWSRKNGGRRREGRGSGSGSGSERSANRLDHSEGATRGASRDARRVARLSRALRSTEQYSACRRVDSTLSLAVVAIVDSLDIHPCLRNCARAFRLSSSLAHRPRTRARERA